MGLAAWLGDMGQRGQHRRVEVQGYNRLTILWADKSVIKTSELLGELQFETHKIYASRLKVNARKVEDALQVRRCLPLAAAACC